MWGQVRAPRPASTGSGPGRPQDAWALPSQLEPQLSPGLVHAPLQMWVLPGEPFPACWPREHTPSTVKSCAAPGTLQPPASHPMDPIIAPPLQVPGPASASDQPRGAPPSLHSVQGPAPKGVQTGVQTRASGMQTATSATGSDFRSVHPLCAGCPRGSPRHPTMTQEPPLWAPET